MADRGSYFVTTYNRSRLHEETEKEREMENRKRAKGTSRKNPKGEIEGIVQVVSLEVSTCCRGLSRNSFSRRSGTEACQAKNNQQITDNSLEEWRGRYSVITLSDSSHKFNQFAYIRLKLKDSVHDRDRLLVMFSSTNTAESKG